MLAFTLLLYLFLALSFKTLATIRFFSWFLRFHALSLCSSLFLVSVYLTILFDSHLSLLFYKPHLGSSFSWALFSLHHLAQRPTQYVLEGLLNMFSHSLSLTDSKVGSGMKEPITFLFCQCFLYFLVPPYFPPTPCLFSYPLPLWSFLTLNLCSLISIFCFRFLFL